MNAKAAQELPLSVRESLALLAHSSDRTSPAVFVGRKSEFELLDNAVRGAQRGEAGHTTVIQGVPGAGKTSLLREYAARLLAERDDSGSYVIPVPLQHEHLDAPPEAVVAEIDRQFRQFEPSMEQPPPERSERRLFHGRRWGWAKRRSREAPALGRFQGMGGEGRPHRRQGRSAFDRQHALHGVHQKEVPRVQTLLQSAQLPVHGA